MKESEKYREKMEQNIAAQRSHFERHKELIDLLDSVKPLWTTSSKERSADLTYATGIATIEAVSLNLYLDENDSLQDVQMFIDEHIIPLLLTTSLSDKAESEPYRYDSNETGWTAWTWQKGPLGELTRVMVRAWYSMSKKCRLEPTGEKTDVLRLVCDG